MIIISEKDHSKLLEILNELNIYDINSLFVWEELTLSQDSQNGYMKQNVAQCLLTFFYPRYIFQ